MKKDATNRPSKRRGFRRLLIVASLCALAGGGLYLYIVSGGLRANRRPPALETFIAGTLVDLSIPRETKALKNTADLSFDGADVAAGHDLYQKHCEVCHGYDGSGKTATSGGLYPPPLDLRRFALLKRKRTDGELFYFIRNGIRNTGMPGWQLPDQQTWQLVAFVRTLPETVFAGRNCRQHKQRVCFYCCALCRFGKLQKLSQRNLRDLAQNTDG